MAKGWLSQRLSAPVGMHGVSAHPLRTSGVLTRIDVWKEVRRCHITTRFVMDSGRMGLIACILLKKRIDGVFQVPQLRLAYIEDHLSVWVR